MKSKIDLGAFSTLQRRPEPFTPGKAMFWNDPHISAQMLKAHLDPNTDAASRRPETIDAEVAWLVQTMHLKPGDAIIDLGCGPGLYTSRFDSCGLTVTGVDYSIRSVTYAIEQAHKAGQNITYRYQNYLTLQDNNQFNAACLINGDFDPLPPEARKQLLANVYRALKPGGFFALDVTTPVHHRTHGMKNAWYAVESGFWKPGPHLVLEQGFDYPGQDIYLDQFIIIEENGTVSLYRNWFQDFTAEAITAELETAGFKVVGLWSDLRGTTLKEDAEWIGVVARKP